MKICYDTIDDLRLTKNGNLKNSKSGKSRIYYFYESCKECNEPFLSDKKNPLYCSSDCCAKNEKWKESIKNFGERNGFKGLFGKLNSNWKGGFKEIKNKVLFDTYSDQLLWCESVRRSPINTDILEVKCIKCNKWFMPTRPQVSNRIQYFKGNYKHESNFYCSNGCKDSCSIYRKTAYSIQRNDEINAGNFDIQLFLLYKNRCHTTARKVYNKFKNIINPLSLPLGRNKNHIDHKYSVYDGFINNIPIYIISSLYNLQILDEKSNISKGKKSIISKDELLKNSTFVVFVNNINIQ